MSIIESYINSSDWRVKENSNTTYSFSGLVLHTANSNIAKYMLNNVFSKEVSQAHREGWFHIHDLGLGLCPYSYFGKEIVIVKENNKIKLVSFEFLYDTCPEEEICINEDDLAFAKYPTNLYVLDKDGWVRVKRLVKKKKIEEMYFIKNRGGRSIIVTANHPMITQNGEKEARRINKEVDMLFTVDLQRLLKDEKLFSINEIDLLEVFEGYDSLDSKRHIYFNGIRIDHVDKNNKEDGLVHTGSHSVKRKIPLTEEFGYFVGFALAEGYLSYEKKNTGSITLSCKDIEKLIQINKALLKVGVSGIIFRKTSGICTLSIYNSFIRYLFERVFNIKPGSRDKTLPIDILMYNKDFVKGVLAGLIDGDGNISSETCIAIRIISRSMLEQVAIVGELLGFTMRDRNVEGVGSTRYYMGREIIQNYPLYGVGFRKLDTIDLPSDKYIKTKTSKSAWHDETKDSWHKVINCDKTNIPDKWVYDITTDSGTLLVNGMLNHNCMGWSLERLIMEGIKKEPIGNQAISSPAKHLNSIINHMVNFLGIVQMESAGAQSFSSVDTYLAPFVKVDSLSYKEVKQHIQSLIFHLNFGSRWGAQAPFVNFTLDIIVPEDMKNRPAIVGGKYQDFTYGDCQKEMDMINLAILEVLEEGDSLGKPFSFPIINYNITKEFPWDSPITDRIFEVTAKNGFPYFTNFINTDMKPSDTRSMCCKLRLDKRELIKRGGGLFGAADQTGAIQVVTINLPRIGFLSKTEREYFDLLDHYLELALEAHITKRKLLNECLQNGLYPFTKYYLGTFRNHFSVFGIIGMHESLMNFMGVSLDTKEGQDFAIKVLDFINSKIQEFQEKTPDVVYNQEATPGESCSYRLAKEDLKRYPNIITSGTKSNPYYTNSVLLPVNYSSNIFEVLEIENKLLPKFTGGSSLHIHIGEKINNFLVVKKLVKRICYNYEIPYFSISPVYSICPEHGFISGEHFKCPTCGMDTEVYSRIVGYYSSVNNWNKGKRQEFKERVYYDL